MRPSNCWDGGTSSLDSLFAWPLVGLHASRFAAARKYRPRRSLCRWLWLGNVTQYADSEALFLVGESSASGRTLSACSVVVAASAITILFSGWHDDPARPTGCEADEGSYC
jgi:hypothetical protein